MIENTREVSTFFSNKIEFSICTLVTDKEEYEQMQNSFIKAGFEEKICEYIYIDNSVSNTFDAYDGLNHFLNYASGKYIILCHQDILLDFDNISILRKRLLELDSIDSNWAVAANAGYKDFNTKVIRITDPNYGTQSVGDFPSRTMSADENFIVVKNSANLALSNDLEGFHLYGTDLCQIAEMLGYTNYVIDFHLYHKSGGNCSTSFYESRGQFMRKYSRKFKPKFIQTMCTTMVLVSSFSIVNKIFNHRFIYSIIKRLGL